MTKLKEKQKEKEMEMKTPKNKRSNPHAKSKYTWYDRHGYKSPDDSGYDYYNFYDGYNYNDWN